MKSYGLIRLATVAPALSLAATALSRDRATDRLILQPDGLHKAALASGGTYEASAFLSPPKYRMSNLNDLVAGSSTIVVVTVSNANAELQDEGRFIAANWQDLPTFSHAVA